MTTSKAALVGFQDEHQAGVITEAEIRTVADALGHKRGRAAFPDDFVSLMKPFRKRVVEKHPKNTDEGRFLRAVQEVRIRAAPSWSSTQVRLNLMLIFADHGSIQDDAPDQHLTYCDKGMAMLRRLIRRNIRRLAAGEWVRPGAIPSAGLVPAYCHDTALTVPAANDDDALVRSVGTAVTGIVLASDQAGTAERAMQVKRQSEAYQSSLRGATAAE